MVTRQRTKAPSWVISFRKRYKEPTAADLRRRKASLKRALALREELDIRPDTTQNLVRQLRDEGNG
jgi:hypothetical protein